MTNPTDFKPSLATGSGSSKLTFVRGAIVAVLPIHNGFVIYTTQNAISAYWSGDGTSPWVFREIPGSSGITNPEHVSYDSNYGSHFAWTTSGLMQVSKEAGVLAFPEITDFLTSGRLEDYIGDVNKSGQGTCEYAFRQLSSEKQIYFNPDAENLIAWSYEGQLKIKVGFVGSRYVAISYGMNERLTHILVYDLALRRWGKLRIDHVDVFQYNRPSEQLNFGVKHSFGILQANGTILSVDFTHSAECTDSVLLFGRIQHSRAQQTTLYSVELDGIIYPDTRLTWLPSFDGATVLPDYNPTCVIHNNNTIKSAGRFTAKNFVVKVSGAFSLSNLQFMVESAAGGR